MAGLYRLTHQEQIDLCAHLTAFMENGFILPGDAVAKTIERLVNAQGICIDEGDDE